MIYKQPFIITALLSFFLTACGGSSGSSEEKQPVTNKLPSVAVENIAVQEKQTITLVADVADPDGSISNYQWQLTSEHDLAGVDFNNSTLEFIAPNVSEDTTLSFTLTVTDNSGGKSSADFQVIILANTLTLTLQGNITDPLLAGADITVDSQSQNFEYQSMLNEDGSYSVSIAIDDDLQQQLVRLTAQGVAENSAVKYTSVLSSFAHLTALASEDKLLTGAEYQALNITSLTTAQYAILIDNNEGQDITNRANLDQLLDNLQPEFLIKLASAIRVIIDNKELDPTFALPEGVSNTLDFSLSEMARMDLFNRISKSHYEEFGYNSGNVATALQIAEQQLLDDLSVVPELATLTEDKAYYLMGVNQESLSFDLNVDGTGTWSTEKRHEQMLWQQAGNKILIAVANPVAAEVYNGSEYVNITYPEHSVTRVIENDFFTMFRVVSTKNEQYVSGAKDDKISLEYNYHIAYQTKNITSPVANFKSAYIRTAFPYQNIEPTVGIRADEFSFNIDGSGTTTLQQKNFSWSLLNNKLTIDFDQDSSKIELQQLNNYLGRPHLVATIIENEEIIAKVSQEGVISKQSPQWQQDKIVGIYEVQHQIYSGLEQQYYSWIELNSDHTFRGIHAGYNYHTGEGGISLLYDGHWQLNENGAISLTRYRDKNTGEFYLGCNQDNSDCIPYYIMNWQLTNIEGDVYSVFEERDFEGRYTYPGYIDDYDYHYWRFKSVKKLAERPVNIDKALIDALTQ